MSFFFLETRIRLFAVYSLMGLGTMVNSALDGCVLLEPLPPRLEISDKMATTLRIDLHICCIIMASQILSK